jgi:anti-sigma-K factor RskA
MNVEEQLRALREAEQHVMPPPRLASRVMQAFDEAGAKDAPGLAQPDVLSSHRRWRFTPAKDGALGALAVAAIVALAAGITLLNREAPQPVLVSTPSGEDVESVVLTVEPPGVEETVRIVRMRVAPSALKGIGIESDRIPPGEALVDVDVLVGEDGVARGVRLGL